MNLYEKIQAVSLEVKNIEKDMQVGNAQYGYKAVSDNVVTLRVKEAEKNHRILSLPIKQELLSSEKVKTLNKQGKEVLYYEENIKMTLRIVDLDKTEDYIDVESFGKGLDTGDKGFGKASTYARKYALLNAYKIATGEDLDTSKSEELTQITVDEKKVLVMNVLNSDIELSSNIASHFGVSQMSELTESNISYIYGDFKKKGRL